MSRVELTENTLRLVQRIFPPEHPGAVIESLEARCGPSLPLWHAPTPQGLERIRFAVLKLSSGSLAQFERAIELANADWRDVLVAAGLATVCALI